MFCCSLRSREMWSEVATKLLSTANVGWKECPLNGVDVKVPIRTKKNEHLNIALFTNCEVKTSEAKAKLQRIRQVKDQQRLAIIVLMLEENGITTFLELQREFLHDRGVSIIVLPSMPDVIRCIEELYRAVATQTERSVASALNVVSSKDVAAACGEGGCLSESQAEALMENTSGLKELASVAVDVDGHDALLDTLGYDTGTKVVSWMTSAPKPVYK